LARILLGVDYQIIYMLPLLFSIVLALAFYRQWDTLVDLLLSYLTVEGMLKILSDYHPFVHVGVDLLTLAIGFLWFISIKELQREGIWPPLRGLVFFYVAWTFIMLFHPNAISLFASLASFKVHLTMLVLFFLGYSQCRSLDKIERAMLIVGLLGTFISLVGLLQYLQGSESLYSLSSIYRDRSEAIGGDFRPWSTTNAPGGISFGAFISTACWLGLINSENTPYNRKIAYTIMFLISLIALPLSQVRIMVLAVLCGATIFLIICGKRILKRTIFTALLLVLLGFVGYYGAITLATRAGVDEQNIGNEFQVVGRMHSLLKRESYEQYTGNIFNTLIDVTTTYPLGQGLNRVGPGAAQFISDGGGPLLPGLYENTFSATISELGLPGLLLQIALLVGVLIRIKRVMRLPGQPRRVFVLGAAIISYLLTCWIAGMKGPIFFGGLPAAIYWYFLGLGLSLAEQSPAPASALRDVQVVAMQRRA
jgi:hypothetical protein